MFPTVTCEETLKIFIPQQSSTVVENEKSYIRKNALMITFNFCKKSDEKTFIGDMKDVRKCLTAVENIGFIGRIWFFIIYVKKYEYLYEKNFKKIIRMNKCLVEKKFKRAKWNQNQEVVVRKVVQKLPNEFANTFALLFL
ncbi:hypothetical protein RFI_37796 [Reticulomyxa filosa]|uniref:Uncharacterized protein n=1 Tax=Reticulomyxa filosa TaxID=46433 RepID=X6LDP3_RETFI|nr:hypothetical protein RFI_37796 [Reticulomyxa filosa]|eukprot:ETN99673.1 hypothetical protein RFI_37796 [Reticulomyxa filosa]